MSGVVYCRATGGLIMRERKKRTEFTREQKDSANKATIKYTQKAYDRCDVKMPKGRRADIHAAAEAVGESMNAFILTAIEQRIERGN